MITIPLDTTSDDSVVYREVFKYLKKNVAPEFNGDRRYSWLHYSRDNDAAEKSWTVITAPAGQLTITTCPDSHETVLALKYGLVSRRKTWF